MAFVVRSLRSTVFARVSLLSGLAALALAGCGTHGGETTSSSAGSGGGTSASSSSSTGTSSTSGTSSSSSSGGSSTSSASSSSTTASSSSGGSSLCSATSQTVAWTAQIKPTASTLTMAGIAAGPTNDVVVADRSGGTAFEQHRWNLMGTPLGVHQDAIGAYAGPFWTTTNLIIDAGNDLFYGLLETGMVQGTNSASQLLFNRISPGGQVVFSDVASGMMPAGNPPPSVQFFFAAQDSGGGLHGPLLMASPAVFAPGVYCYGPSGNNNGISAAGFVSTLSSKDTVLGAPDAGLFVAHPMTASATDNCGALTVPAAGAMEIMRTDVGGGCTWHKLLSVPTAAVKASSFHLGADGSLTLAVVYSGTIDLGSGSLTSTGASSLAVGRYLASTGAVIWAKGFGGAGSSFTLGSVDTNVNGRTVVTGGYTGSVSFGGATLPANDDTFLAVLDAAGNLKWDKTVTVGSSGSLLAASGPCGLAVATNSTTVTLGGAPLSTVTPPGPPSIGVAAIAF